jgi:hypothetical protein
MPSEGCSIEEQSTEYCGQVVSSGMVNQTTRHNAFIHYIPSTAPHLNISQKALGTLPEDGNVMPEHVGYTIHN